MFFTPLAAAVGFPAGILEDDQIASKKTLGAKQRDQPGTDSSLKGRQIRSMFHRSSFSYILRIYKNLNHVKSFFRSRLCLTGLIEPTWWEF